MTDMDALFILYWRTTTNQFLFIYPPVRLNMRHWRIILHLFFIKSCDFFVSIFSFFFYYFYMHMYVKSPAHSLTHSPVVPKMKKKIEQKVEQSTQLEMSGCTCYWRSQMLVRYYCCHCTCAASYLQHSFAAWLLWHTIAKQQGVIPTCAHFFSCSTMCMHLHIRLDYPPKDHRVPQFPDTQ